MHTLSSHLRPIGTPRLFRKQEHLLFQGEIPQGPLLILDGIVKAYTITSAGDERIVALYGKGDLLPIEWALAEAPTAFLQYEALNDTRTLFVPKTAFQTLLKTDHEFRGAVIAMLSKEYTAMLFRSTGLVQSKAVDKISYTLYYLMFRYGIDRGNGTFMIDLKLSQTTLAELIGQTRESTAKNLKFLKDKGIIDYSASIYTVYRPKLEAFLGEDAFLSANLDLQLDSDA